MVMVEEGLLAKFAKQLMERYCALTLGERAMHRKCMHPRHTDDAFMRSSFFS